MDDFSQHDRYAAIIVEFRSRRRGNRAFQDVTYRIAAGVHHDVIVVRVGVGTRPLVPGKSGCHRQAVAQADRALFRIGKQVGIFGKKGRYLLVDAANQMLVNRDPDEDGIHALGRRRHIMQRGPFEVPERSALVPAREVSFHHELAVFDDQHAVNVLVGAVVDASNTLGNRPGIETAFQGCSRPIGGSRRRMWSLAGRGFIVRVLAGAADEAGQHEQNHPCRTR